LARNAYRAVYTVRFAGAVYILHCFEKKSKRGIETPKREMDLIRARLKEAEARALGLCDEQSEDSKERI
jgi:phage-related protein